MFFSQPLHFVTHTLTNLIPLMPYTPSHALHEGRHSFAGSESISKRDQDLNEFLKKNFSKPTDFKPDLYIYIYIYH